MFMERSNFNKFINIEETTFLNNSDQMKFTCVSIFKDTYSNNKLITIHQPNSHKKLLNMIPLSKKYKHTIIVIPSHISPRRKQEISHNNQ